METTPEIAWAAGLFEGEGCISLSHATGRTRDRTQARLILSSTDQDVVERFAEVVGVGTLKKDDYWKEHYGYKSQWRWQTSSQAVVRVLLEQFMPWFGARRQERASEVLAALK